MDNLYTVRDVAKVLGISTHTVRKWLQENRLPVIRFGRCVRFDPAAIDRFVQSHSVEPRWLGAAPNMPELQRCP